MRAWFVNFPKTPNQTPPPVDNPPTISITSPVNGLVYTNWVNFNASQSYVANCSTTMTGSDFDAGNLKCKYIHAPGTKIITGNYNISVTWEVREADNSNSLGFPVSANWASNYSDIVDFTRYFTTAAKRSASLTLDYSG